MHVSGVSWPLSRRERQPSSPNNKGQLRSQMMAWTGEMQGRCRGGAGEMQGRCRGDTDLQPRGLAPMRAMARRPRPRVVQRTYPEGFLVAHGVDSWAGTLDDLAR